MKKIFLIGFLCGNLLSADEKWTIGLSTTSNLENANTYIDKSPDKYMLSINKIDEKKFHINYGFYNSYDKSKKVLKTLNNSGAYVRKVNTSTKYTIGLATTSTLLNAKAYINELQNFPKNHINIRKIADKYQVNYGIYDTYEESKNRLKTLFQETGIKNSYIRKILAVADKNKEEKKEVAKVSSIVLEELMLAKELEQEELANTTIDNNNFRNLNNSNNEPISLIKTDIQPNSIKEDVNYDYIDNSNNYNTQEYVPVVVDNTLPVDTNNEVRYEDEIYQTPTYNSYNKYQSVQGLEVSFSPIKLSGDFSFGLNGTKIDFVNDLGINDSSNGFIPQIFYAQDNHKVFLNYTPLSYKGTSIINKDLKIDNYTYLSGQTLNSTIKTNTINTGYRYNIYNFDLGFDYYNINSKIDVTNGTNTTNIMLDYNIFSLGIDKQHQFFDKYLLSYGINYGISTDASLLGYNLSTGIKDIYFRNNSINLGYQSKVFDVSNELYNGKTNYDGLYINFNQSF